MLHTTPTDPAALARRPDPAGPLAVATPTTRKLADASLSVNTRRAYAGALRRLDTWRGTAPLTDAVAGRLPRRALRGGPRARHRRPRRRRRPVSGQARRPAGPRRGKRPPACWAATVARPPTGAGARPPRCARTGSPRFSPPPPGPARTAGASNPPPTAHRRGRLDRRDRLAVVYGRAAAVGSRRFALGRRDGRHRRRRGACHRADLENGIKRGTPPTCGI